MDLRPYVENIQNQLLTAAEAGPDDARELAQRLLAPLDAAMRLTLQDALAAAAEEITCELAPGSVELRLRGGELEFAVTAPPTEAGDGSDQDDDDAVARGRLRRAATTARVSRINLRMPENLKARVERAASGEGLSVNSWLVRAAASSALDRGDATRRPVQNVTREHAAIHGMGALTERELLEGTAMSTFQTPQPISVTVELGVGEIRIQATDRTDTVVEVRPSNSARKSDVSAARANARRVRAAAIC